MGRPFESCTGFTFYLSCGILWMHFGSKYYRFWNFLNRGCNPFLENLSSLKILQGVPYHLKLPYVIMQYDIFTEKAGWFSLYFYMYLEITEEFTSNSLLIFQKGNQLHLHPRKRGPMRMKLKFLNQKDPIFVGSQSPWWMFRWLNGGGSSPRQLSSSTQPSSLRPRIQIHC